MKLMIALFAILAVFGLGQARQFPDFGEGPLHEHIHDFLDLVPVQEMQDVVLDYYANDAEVREAVEYLANTTLLENLWKDFVSIPELQNLLDYLKREGIGTKHVVSAIHKVFKIKKLVPMQREFRNTKERTGGIAGLFKDIRQLIDYGDYISLYADKIQTSPTFVRFMKELKSENFQQIVNKLYRSQNFQFIRNHLKRVGVNVKLVEDILYLVLGVTTPPKTLTEEIAEFVQLIPMKQYVEIYIKYLNEDEKVREAVKYMLTPEFHDLQRNLESLQEFNALVIFFENAGLSIVELIQVFHQAIGMDKYVPAYMERFLQQTGKPQEVGEGMKAMLEDLHKILPAEEIDALFEEKLVTSRVFADFLAKLTSQEMRRLITALSAQQAFKQYLTQTLAIGLEVEGLAKLSARMIGIK